MCGFRLPVGAHNTQSVRQMSKAFRMVRLLPLIIPSPEAFASWRPPPVGWLFGNWKFTYTSQPLYLAKFSKYAVLFFPYLPGKWISTWADERSHIIPTAKLVDNCHLYGIDTPRRSSNTSLGLEWEAVFDSQGVGALSRAHDSWAVLAWGYDTCGIPFIVTYETEVVAITSSPALDISSRGDQGPTKETLTEIFTSLRALGDEGISTLVEQMKQMIQDGERRGQPPVVCDESCLNNTGTVA